MYYIEAAGGIIKKSINSRALLQYSTDSRKQLPPHISPSFFFFELKRIIGPAAAAGHSQLESLNR
jgi:hypothetical protein